MMNKTIIFLLAGILIGCGGGSSGSSRNPPTGIQPAEPVYRAGVFQPASNFYAACANPRSGINPATGAAYADTQGSVLMENHWLRAWSNDLYLWYDEIEDRDPALTSNPIDYFALLKTEATTTSGSPRDNFHFTYPTQDWYELSTTGTTAGYGATFVLIATTPPRQLVVAYVEPDSPAATAGLARGTEIIAVDGIDLINENSPSGVANLNSGLFPARNGEEHEFTIRDFDKSNLRTVSLTSAEITVKPVLKADIIPNGSDNLGYLLFNDHLATAEAQLITAFQMMRDANVADLILDLRYNSGGFLTIASQLAFMIAGPAATEGRVFENLRFNDKHRERNPVTGKPLQPLPFLSETAGFSVPSGQPLPTLNLARVFILTGSGTCSASESIINSLLGINVEVIQIGTTTCGKPYGFYPQDNCGTTYFTIQFAGENDVGFGDYIDGFSPTDNPTGIGEPVIGCTAGDDFSHALGDLSETLLETALAFRNTGSCPATASATARRTAQKPQGGPANIQVLKSLWRQNRILNDF